MKAFVLAVALAAGAAVACSGKHTAPPGSQVPPGTQTAAAEASVMLTPIPTPAHARPWERVFAPPSQVLATGEPVPFKVCSRATGWRKPTLEEMQPVFTDRRFGDGVRPRPLDFALYLASFYYVSTPTANSANKDINAFSGFYLGPDGYGRTETSCDYDGLYRIAVGTAVGGKAGSVPPPFQAFRLADHHVLDMRRDADHFVVCVDAAADSWEDVIFPFPPASGFFETAPGLSAIDVVSQSGALLYRWRREAYVDWYEDWQYEEDGRLRYIQLASVPPLISTPLDLTAPVSLTLLPGSLRLDGLPFPAGAITVRDTIGREVARQSWTPSMDEWQPLAGLVLAAGSYTITIDVPNDTPVGATGLPYRTFVLIRDDIPLP